MTNPNHRPRYMRYAIKDISRSPRFAPVSFMKRGNSTTYSVLRYLKMKRNVPSTTRQIVAVFPKFFVHPSDAGKIVRTLKKHGFCETVYEGAWRITPAGVAAVYLMSQRDRLNVFEDMD